MNKKILITILLLLTLCFVCQPNVNYYKTHNYKILEYNKSEKQKSKILNRIKKYNPFVKTVLIDDIHRTLKTFNLLCYSDILVSQLCLESKGGNKKGKSKYVIGIGQITPETAFHYLMNKTNNKDINLLDRLNVSSFDFIYNNKDRYIIDKSVRLKMIQWLSKEHNNVVLWGFIMKKKIEKHKTINKALIAYNGGGNKNYVKSVYNIKKNIK